MLSQAEVHLEGSIRRSIPQALRLQSPATWSYQAQLLYRFRPCLGELPTVTGRVHTFDPSGSPSRDLTLLISADVRGHRRRMDKRLRKTSRGAQQVFDYKHLLTAVDKRDNSRCINVLDVNKKPLAE